MRWKSNKKYYLNVISQHHLTVHGKPRLKACFCFFFFVLNVHGMYWRMATHATVAKGSWPSVELQLQLAPEERNQAATAPFTQLKWAVGMRRKTCLVGVATKPRLGADPTPGHTQHASCFQNQITLLTFHNDLAMSQAKKEKKWNPLPLKKSNSHYCQYTKGATHSNASPPWFAFRDQAQSACTPLWNCTLRWAAYKPKTLHNLMPKNSEIQKRKRHKKKK